MAAPLKFSDIGKTFKDLVGKDYPSDFELEANSTTANKLKFTVTGKQDVATGVIKAGELKAKYTDNKHNLTFTESYDLSSKVRLQTEVKGLGVAGSKLEADASVDLKSSTSPYGLAISASFAKEYVNWNSKFDLVKKEVNMDLVTGYEGFLVGGEVKLDVNNAAKAEYNLVASYATADYNVSFRANKNLKSYTLSFCHDVTNDLRVGAQGGWDGSNSSLSVGCQVRLDRDSMVKAKADHNGAIGLSYTQQIRPDVKVTVGTGFQSVTKDIAKPHVGLSFVFGK